VGVAKRILVAEDDPVTCRFVVSLLEDRGYEVVIAEDGERAATAAVDVRPDLIVSDLVMPYRDGYELLRAVRNDERTKSTPLILLSMRDREEDIVRGLEQGADDYVVKPFNAREFLARVRKLLDAKGL